MMKAREIRELLHNVVDPRLGKVLVALAEEQSIQKQQIAQLAMLLDTVANALMTQTAAFGNIQTGLDLAIGITKKNQEIRDAYSDSGRVSSEDIGDATD